MPRRPSSALANAVASGVRVPHIEPLQTRIAKNRWRFVLFMVLFTTAVAVTAFVFVLLLLLFVAAIWIANGVSFDATMGWTATGAAFTFALVGAWIWSLVRFSHAEVHLIKRLGARMPRGGTLLSTKSMLRDMAIAAGLKETPQFYVIETKGVNAFVLGRSIEHIRIGVTTGLLERIGPEEQRAVFANLIARVLARDTLWATAVSALMGPIWKMREYDLAFEPARHEYADEFGRQREVESDWRASAFPAYGLAVIITEFLSWYHREAAWKAAEKADAEGMMLLKDPRSMLHAIEHVLERDNHVPSAGDAYSQLFFCWAGFGFAPEDDPEMRRVSRLRETLGAEGCAYISRPNVPDWNRAPVAPRIELAEELAELSTADEVWP